MGEKRFPSVKMPSVLRPGIGLLIGMAALCGDIAFAQCLPAGPIMLEGFEAPALAAPNAYKYSPANAVWTFGGTTGSGIQRNGSGWGAAPAPEGQQTAFLQGGDAHISQMITLPAGTYNISFYAARRPYDGNVVNPVQVKVNGNNIGVPIRPTNTAFVKYTSNNFPLSSNGSYKVELVSTNGAAGDYATFIDAVAVNPVNPVDTTTTPAFSVNVTKSGAGSVTSAPAGINCGTACSASFASGVAVQLTAAAQAGNTFTGWGGACAGTASTCTVVADAVKMVTAAFAAVPPADTTPPVVSITNPSASGAYTSSSASVSVSGSASDNIGVTQVSWSNNRGGSGTASFSVAANTAWTASGIALQDGANTLTITARDAASNLASSTIVVSYSPAQASAGSPALSFTDLVSGPRSGNSDNSQAGQVANADGAIVTLWGKNLGNGANSTIKVGGVPARVYYWGVAAHGGGANLSGRQGMQMIEFQIPHTAPLGAVDISVNVNGVDSNTLPFTTRDTGKIYFIGAGQAASDNNAGAYSSPWRSFYPKALNTMAPGDIAYFMDGFTASATAQVTGGGMLPLGSSGTAAAPKAIVAYPGATVTIGGTSCETSGHAMVRSFNFAGNSDITDWVISKLRVASPASCAQSIAIDVGSGYRVVANYVSTPRTDDGCQSGTLQCGGIGTCGNNVAILGNELTAIQTTNKGTGSKQCHGIYVSGSRLTDQLESNREIAWNYIHDNSNNRAINVYNERYNPTHAFITGHQIHDNWIENQSGIGILIGQDVVGQNWLYNNVLVNAGLGPDHGVAGTKFVDDGAFYPLQINIGSPFISSDSASNTARDNTVLHAYNNLVYGRSNPELLIQNSNMNYAIGLMDYAQLRPSASYPLPTMNFYNNIMIATVPGVPYLEPYSSSRPNGKNNLWYGAGAPPAGETAAITPADITSLFVNAAGGNFHLNPAGTVNPARNAGITVPINHDFDGAPRKQGAAVDLGPYEAP